MDVLLLVLGVSETTRLPSCIVHGGGCRLIRPVLLLERLEVERLGRAGVRVLAL